MTLRAFKHRYFNDKALKIWNLCHSYFTRTNSINSSRRISDYLLVKDFNIVFENIIDHVFIEDIQIVLNDVAGIGELFEY